ncbi:MAG: hypothetical protein WCT05_15775 [Lentisphaeria bacterium]
MIMTIKKPSQQFILTLLLLSWLGLRGAEPLTWQAGETLNHQHKNWLDISSSETLLQVRSSGYVLQLDAKRNYILNDFYETTNNWQLLENISFSLAGQQGATQMETYCGNRVTELQLELQEHAVELIIKQTWPMLQLTKCWSFYQQQPFVRLIYKITMSADWQCGRATLNLVTASGMQAVAYHANEVVNYRANTGATWFNLPRSDQQRWLGYVNDNNSAGVALIGADPWNWQELPGQLLSSARKDGGFSVELIKWGKQELRPGDQTTINIFLAPFTGSAGDQGPALQQQIAPGF